MPGETFPAHRGASALICWESDLPSIWMPPSGYGHSSSPEIPVVQREGLLEPGRVRLLRHRHQRQVVVPQVVAADHVGAVGQTVRVGVAGGPQQQRGRVHRTAGDHHDVRAERDRSRVPVDPGDDLRHRPAGRVGPQPLARTRRSAARPRRWPPPGRRTPPARRTSPGPGRGTRPPGRTGCRRCPGWRTRPRPGQGRPRSAGGTGAARASPCPRQLLDARLVLDRRVRVVPARTGPRSGPRRAARAPGRGARPRCSTAPGRRSRSARPARARRGAAARRSPPAAAGTAPPRRTSCSRRRSS